MSSKRYIPSEATLNQMVWRKRYFKEENRTPLFHYKILDHYFAEGSYIKPVKAFRGSAKSTNTCYTALHSAENPNAHYTLIISDTATQAEALVADINDMLRDSSLSYTVVHDVAGEIELLVNGKRYFIVAKGAGSSMRGIKRNRKRADLIILDDIINDSLVMNRLRIDRLNRWFYKALLPSLSPDGEVYAVGTPLHSADLFLHLCSLHSVIEIPLTDTAWPDRFSPTWIENKKQEYIDAGMLREYKQEFELILTDKDTQLFDMNKVRFEYEIPQNVSWFMTCDLAFSEKDAADYSALIVNGIDRDGNWHIYPVQGRWKPSETAGKIFELVNKFNVIEVGVEGGSSYIAVREHLDQLMMDYQSFFNISELKHGGKSKISRISALEPVVNLNKLSIIDITDETSSESLVEQMELTDGNACMASHDDLLDSLAYQVQMNLYYDNSSLPTREDYNKVFKKDKTKRDYL